MITAIGTAIQSQMRSNNPRVSRPTDNKHIIELFRRLYDGRGKGEDEKYNIHAKKASIDRSLPASLAACVNAGGSTGF
jgi:hypothetical protein